VNPGRHAHVPLELQARDVDPTTSHKQETHRVAFSMYVDAHVSHLVPVHAGWHVHLPEASQLELAAPTPHPQRVQPLAFVASRLNAFEAQVSHASPTTFALQTHCPDDGLHTVLARVPAAEQTHGEHPRTLLLLRFVKPERHTSQRVPATFCLQMHEPVSTVEPPERVSAPKHTLGMAPIALQSQA